ncbi:glutathione S-transferase family protein [Sphingomonas sp.]|uniref:glutathione S-transferase family protein n=1 Tax=Sphingomonas sp. TaxID=28214 RepID=UPI00286B94EF|nr:glutathione S-transferase family protein [Sphingomonas sp.]
MLQLFAHPFSSYCWKVLIPLWADHTPFDYRHIEDGHPDEPANAAIVLGRSPFGQFPLLIDGDRAIFESTPIIDYLALHHSGPNRWIPDGEDGLRTRFLDRFFDLHVMTNMQKLVGDRLRPEGQRDPFGVAKARANLGKAYDWLEADLGDGPWAIGDTFTLADCTAAPALFYADWVEQIGLSRPCLVGYRARLLAHPVVARAVDEGRPYRAYFPLGAPDRD